MMVFLMLVRVKLMCRERSADASVTATNLKSQPPGRLQDAAERYHLKAMSVSALEESHVSWDVEGWVKAAMRAWANGYEEIQVHTCPDGRGIEILVHGEPVAVVRVRRA